MKFPFMRNLSLLAAALLVTQPVYSQQPSFDIEKAREALDQSQHGSREEYVKSELLIKFKENIHLKQNV